jgi:hypothetical protein
VTEDVDPAAVQRLGDELVIEHQVRHAKDMLQTLKGRAARGDSEAAQVLSDLRLAALLGEREFLLAYDRWAKPEPGPGAGAMVAMSVRCR